MNKYIAVHYHEFAATVKEFDTLADAHNHLLFKSSLIKMDQMDLMAVYRSGDGKLMGAVRPLSTQSQISASRSLRGMLKNLF